ncbi:MAG: tRNA (N6-isopentenyl adenosine(37)-C2)-methylthiotransferase MiaB [Proteobacteria bacterium]|nr:tRNA (N6-isopentenyl adenosine(37)-C2)-methylthiotransferase MiaB [Pseudomonadota bacterium]
MGNSQFIPLGRLGRGKDTEENTEVNWQAAEGMPRVYLETYGCQMNVADSDMLTGVLSRAGYQKTDRADDADVILINTCAVREKAEERVFARARELGVHKKRRSGVILGIAGCMAEHLKAGLLDRAPYVDLIAGPDSYRHFPDLIARAHASRSASTDDGSADDGSAPAGPIIDVQLDRSETYEGLSGAEGGDGVSGFVTIQRGCDKFCTFCVVPFTRGREKGTPPREILRQVRAHADAGYREVVLLGQTVNSYRYEDVGFAQLLRAVARVDNISRIRFTSPYPVDFTSEVIATIADLDKVCNYVHLPVQSGSDRVLERMRRGYTAAEFRAIVAELRARIPDIAISTDILTGFCGETLDDHRETLNLMRELRFDSAFMFLYSERDLTYAGKKLADDVPLVDKKRRLQEIIALQESISAEVFAARVGKRERILIHGRSKRGKDQLVGRTDGFKSVIVPADCAEVGELLDVRIERATMATLFGTPAK